MNSKTLIVGMGFGNAVYVPVYKKLNFEIVTVDLGKDADYRTVADALKDHKRFATVHICTPNFTHEEIAREVAPFASIVFVEKPGVKDSAAWENLVNDFKDTRIVMVKNNQYRTRIDTFNDLALKSDQIDIHWLNKHRVPNPGGWFTNKDLSYGGVSRDLMPHMLSYITKLTDYKNFKLSAVSARQNYDLTTVGITDYGTIDPKGIYNVDYFCSIHGSVNNIQWNLVSSWKTGKEDNSSITFTLNTGEIHTFELGLCPELAYENMAVTALTLVDYDMFWNEQFTQDLWIHKQLENL